MSTRMDESEIFRLNLIRLRGDSGMNAKELSLKAGLGERAVKDIEERRSQSPKIKTVFALAKALNADVSEILGLKSRHNVNDQLAEYLSKYDEGEQERLLSALALLPDLGSSKP